MLLLALDLLLGGALRLLRRRLDQRDRCPDEHAWRSA